ncbi:histidine phosphatase family protein [Bradyrhizobium sp.]|uniref:histidine phosphatase family protein n=1 Tax=Bradyrhizobium sp. TaxID=376 RepID=UPI003C781A42
MPELISIGGRDKASSVIRAANPGLGKGRHPDVTGKRGARQQDRHAGAGGLAEPHAEIEQRLKAELAQQFAVAGFGRDVPGAAVIQHACVKARERQDGGGRDEPVEQNGNASPPRHQQDFGAWTGRRHNDLVAKLGNAYREFFVDQIDRAKAGLASLPAGDAVLVVHSGTIRAVLAIALDLEPDSALRFVIDPLSLTRIDRLESGWRVLAVNWS